MANTSIKTSTSKMREGARQIAANLNEIRKQYNVLRAEGIKLNGYWSGQGHDEFKRKFDSDCTQIQEYITEVSKYYNSIMTVVKSYEKGEEEVIKMASKRK